MPGLREPRHRLGAVADAALEVRLELPEHAAPGAALEGRLTVSNTVDEPVSVVAPPTAAALTLVVLDRHWNVVVPEAAAKVHTAPEELQLAPGESVAWDLTDLSFVSGTAQMRYSLPPGSYHVLAVYHPWTEVVVSGIRGLEITEPGA